MQGELPAGAPGWRPNRGRQDRVEGLAGRAQHAGACAMRRCARWQCQLSRRRRRPWTHRYCSLFRKGNPGKPIPKEYLRSCRKPAISHTLRVSWPLVTAFPPVPDGPAGFKSGWAACSGFCPGVGLLGC